jgi:RNA polymerase subunit RPABC4/transcription elongation factor Spt4
VSRCEDCGSVLERAGCPNCSDEAFLATEALKNRWAEEDTQIYQTWGNAQ